MKQFISLLMVAFLVVGAVGTTIAGPTDSDKEKAAIEALEASAVLAVSSQQWSLFSDRLVEALGSEHGGIQQTAMRLVIRHGDNVEVEDAVFDVMRVYRDGSEENLRRMAVVTLANMNSGWAIKFLERSERFEKSTVVRQTIHAVISEANAS